jgi:predicted O-methyltransferase YrrM
MGDPVIHAQLQTRPRLLNLLHAIGLSSPATQTVESELACLRRYAHRRRIAVEIGTFQGVSAAVIARALSPGGTLYCVDPWTPVNGRENPIYTIARRHLARSGAAARVEFVQAFSRDAVDRLPSSIDFAFIDGDHTFEGLEFDWALLAPRISPGGIVCLHDTSEPANESGRLYGSVRYFQDVIRFDPRFVHRETVHSLNVLERVAS